MTRTPQQVMRQEGQIAYYTRLGCPIIHVQAYGIMQRALLLRASDVYSHDRSVTIAFVHLLERTCTFVGAQILVGVDKVAQEDIPIVEAHLENGEVLKKRKEVQ